MSHKVTAKAVVSNARRDGEQTTVTIGADYADGRNAEWARYTPGLSLTIGVRNELADLFPVGGRLTLTFELDEDGITGEHATDGIRFVHYQGSGEAADADSTQR